MKNMKKLTALLLAGAMTLALAACGNSNPPAGNGGTIIGLAMGDENRTPNIPDVPTFKECGGTMVSGAFRGFACRADVPDDIYNYLVAEFDKIITSDKFIQAMNDAAIPYSYRSAADFQAYAESVSASMEPLFSEL